MGRAYLFALAEDEREALLQRIRSAVATQRVARRASADRRGLRVDRKARFSVCLSVIASQMSMRSALSVVTADGAVLAFNCGGMPSEVTAAQLENEIGPRPRARRAANFHGGS